MKKGVWFFLKSTLTVVLMLLVVTVSAHTLNIGIYDNSKPSSLLVTAKSGGYDVIADGETVLQLIGAEVAVMTSENGKIRLKTLSEDLGAFKKVYLKRKKWGATFRFKSRSPRKPERIYRDNLTVVPYGSKLRCINNVYIEHYLPGVVEAESGTRATLEYYKVQATIARTYALANRRRHAGEGFNLCDQVHCQVYKGHTEMPTIRQSVTETKSMVLVDSEIRLISAAFHSNCGGHTRNSEDVWTSPVEYLRAKPDSFCLQMPNSDWVCEIDKGKWLTYLNKNYQYPVGDSLQVTAAVNYEPTGNESTFRPDTNILLKQLRKDWQLRSTHFRIEEREDDMLLLKGKGYGHGVGLCQEGAMCMAEYGYTFADILHHYYSDVHLIDLEYIDFFRD